MNNISFTLTKLGRTLATLLITGVMTLQVSGQSASSDGKDFSWIRFIPKTRWVSPCDEKPLRYHEWKADHPDVPFVKGRLLKGSRGGYTEVLVLVNMNLYDTLSVSLAQYMADLELEGYAVEVMSVAGGTPADLKSLLQGREALQGAVLIGDLPVPWFQENYHEEECEEFPIDLYYMDLNGEWLDQYTWDPGGQTFVPGADGILDTHRGDVQPEIWVGRLTASPLYESEISLLESYFSKTHRYREGSLWVHSRALNYIDDDWSGSWTTAGLDSIYDEVVVVDHPETTVASDYAEELVASYEWVGVCAHSYTQAHGFKYNQGQHWSWFHNYQLIDIDPPVLFYNLFACSNARYVASDYMGGWYIFADTYGLGAIGSTKSGSMLAFEEFYNPLGSGACLGEAFREWFSTMAEGGFDTWQVDWFYGMTLLGDPTLVPRLTTHYYLTMNAEPGGGVYPPSGFWEAGSIVKIRAAPSPGYMFTGWVGSGNGSYTGPVEPACITMNGSITETACFSPIVAAPPLVEESSNHPSTFELSQNFPNPFNVKSHIRYGLPQRGHTVIRVYSILGQLVKELVNEELPEGYHESVWDGTDSVGKEVGSGIYFVYMKAGDYTSSKKLVLLR